MENANHTVYLSAHENCVGYNYDGGRLTLAKMS